MGQFVVSGCGTSKSHCEGLHVGRVAAHERDNARGIHATTEETADLDVTFQTQLHRLAQSFRHFVLGIMEGDRICAPSSTLPIRLNLGLPPLVNQYMTRRQFGDTMVECTGCRHVAHGQKVTDRLRIGLSLLRAGEEGFDLRSEEQTCTIHGVEERFLPGPVAS